MRMKYIIENDSKKFYYGKQEDYSRYRPTYSIELFELLSKKDDKVHFDFHTEMFIGKV